MCRTPVGERWLDLSALAKVRPKLVFVFPLATLPTQTLLALPLVVLPLLLRNSHPPPPGESLWLPFYSFPFLTKISV